MRALRVAASLAVLLATTSCSNRSDPRMLDAAESLVPPKSEVTEVIENTTGFSFESGPYFVIYEITDGGLGAGLEGAIVERARAEGWEPTERREALDATELRFARDDLEALVRVWINRDPIDASISIHSAEMMP
jgi:hypothetical protein